MKFKKLLSLSTAFLVSASILTGCGSNKGTEKNDISVGIVLGAGSINDQSFNQSTWEGLQKAKDDFGIEIKYLESKQESDYIQNIETLMDEDTDLITFIKNVVEEYETQIDLLLNKKYKNIESQMFNEDNKNKNRAMFTEETTIKLLGDLKKQNINLDDVTES